MAFQTKYTTWFIGLAVVAGLELVNWQVRYIYWLPGLLGAAFLILVWLRLKQRDWSYKIMVWLIPAINLLAWCSFLSIVNSQIVRQMLIIAATVGQVWYLSCGWPVWMDDIRPTVWWRIVNALDLITIWLLAASLYGLQSFLAWPIFSAWLLWLAFSGLIIWSNFKASKLPFQEHWPIMLADWLVGGELFLVIYFLPSSNLVLAYLILSAYYLFGQVGRASLLKINTAKRLRYQFLVLLIGLLLVLLTAKWF